MTPLAHGWDKITVYLPEQKKFEFRSSELYSDWNSDSTNLRRILFWALENQEHIDLSETEAYPFGSDSPVSHEEG